MVGVAGSVAAQTAPATGDQRREYLFAATGQAMPYRIYVPTTWDGKRSLPILLFLHGAGANESTYLDMAGGLLGQLAEKHGYIVVSLRLHRARRVRQPAALAGGIRRIGDGGRAACRSWRAQRRRELDLSKLEVITALEVVTEEYGADRSRTFLAGHSMGSGGAWHLAARYPERWRAVAPMSGPFIDQATYPFDRIRALPIFVTEGTGAAPSLAGSRALAEFMRAGGLRLRLPRGRRQPRQHGADGLARDLRVFRSRLCAGRREETMRTRRCQLRSLRRHRTLLGRASAQAQTEIRLWPDGAPGSEHWSIPESVASSPSGDRVIANVSDPTLTVFLPDSSVATGAAALIAPGGALRVLGFDNEGVKVAEWLNERGITSVRAQVPHAATGPVRTARSVAGHAGAWRGTTSELVIVNANANPVTGDAALAEVLEFAVADAQAAFRLIRENASDWRIDRGESASSASRPAAASRSAPRSQPSRMRRRTSSSPSTGRRCKT